MHSRSIPYAGIPRTALITTSRSLPFAIIDYYITAAATSLSSHLNL